MLPSLTVRRALFCWSALSFSLVADAQPTIQVSTELVLITASVTDQAGKPFPGLGQSDFQVQVEGQQVPLSFFQEQDSPLSVVLVLDVSSSMAGEQLLRAKEAALEFIIGSHAETEIALVSFSDQAGVVSSFQTERAQMRASVNSLEASGGTALFDALVLAAEVSRQGSHPGRVVLLFTDGQDQDSRADFRKVERVFQSNTATLFVVGEYLEAHRKLFLGKGKYFKKPEFDVNLNPVWVLGELASLSGGTAHFPRSVDDLRPVFSMIARELRHRYVLGFTPPAQQPESRFHPIQIKVEQGGPLRVTARRGYWR